MQFQTGLHTADRCLTNWQLYLASSNWLCCSSIFPVINAWPLATQIFQTTCDVDEEMSGMEEMVITVM